jgi:tetratricopeptide (TPR) repeat protein
VLRDVLNEDPTHEQAHATLSDYWERTGNQAGLVELLRRQLDAALAGNDAGAVTTAALRLGERLLATEPGEVAGIYRRALERAPDDPKLLSALLGRLGPADDPSERALLTERLLAIDPGAEPGPRALELVGLYESLGQPEGAQRALELGHQLAPQNAEIRGRLEQRFRASGDFAGLAKMLLEAAERAEPSSTKALLLVEAARVHRDQLADTGTAAGLLRRALELEPTNHAIVVELAATLRAGGDLASAIDAITVALEAGHEPPARLDLLRSRAALRGEHRDESGAVSDLEEAFAIDPEGTAEALEAALEVQRARAVETSDQATERSATMRLIDVMRARGNHEAALGLLTQWLGRSPDDVPSLRRLREFQTEAQQWDAVIATCDRLIALDEGETQEDAALALLSAYEMLGRAADARATLELAREKQPTSAKIRGALRRLYEQIGAHRELARLLIEEADTMEDQEQRVAYLRWAGQTLVMVGDVEAAVPALRKVLELAEGDVGAAVSLADAHLVAGQFDEADRILDEAANDPKTKRNSRDLAIFVHRKAHVARARGDTDGQLAHLQKAHQVDTKNGDIAAELADLAESLEQWEVASKALRAISLIDGPCRITPAQSLIRQGRIALRQGDKKRALMFARRAKRGDEPDPELDAFMRELEES